MVSATQVDIGSKHLNTIEALEDNQANGKSFKVCCCCRCRIGLRQPWLAVGKGLRGLHKTGCVSDADLLPVSISASDKSFSIASETTPTSVQREAIASTFSGSAVSIKPETTFNRRNNFTSNNSNNQEANKDEKQYFYFERAVNDENNGKIQRQEAKLQRHPSLESDRGGEEKIAAIGEIESESNSDEKVNVRERAIEYACVEVNTISKCENSAKRNRRISSSLENNSQSWRRSRSQSLSESRGGSESALFWLNEGNFAEAVGNIECEAGRQSSGSKSIQLRASQRRDYEQRRAARVWNCRRQPIGRRFTPLELEVPIIARGREENAGGLSYLPRQARIRRGRGRAASNSSKLAALNIDLNEKENEFQNESLFWRLRTSHFHEAPFLKRPLCQLLLLIVLVVSSSLAKSSSSSQTPSRWRTPDGAKLLVSERNSGRQQRQVSPTWTSWTPMQEREREQQQRHYQRQLQHQPDQQQIRHQNVPYKTFFITRACEWKSNLFVPKSNDIHFAQPSPSAASSSNSPTTGSGGSNGELNSQNQESSVVYETFSGNNYANSNNNNVQQHFPRATRGAALNDGARTMLSTDSKALILALPIVMSQSFSGFESACSIRLIVPRNMRILAQLTSRRLTFAQQLISDNQIITNPDQISAANFNDELQQQQSPSSLWLNVSQNQFIETEHKSFETEGNVLAFRFLLERFANKQVPDTRFQVVLTAFQTLSDNSDLLDSGQLFICDQQRLISTNLACDGYKNCQDGHDESEATCATFRNQQQAAGAGVGPPFNQNVGPTATNPNQIMSTEQPAIGSEDDRRSVLIRMWNFARETNTIIGFFIGFLLVLLILMCCACCSYGIYMCWLHLCRPWYYSSRNRRDRVGATDGESDALAAQNSENTARQRSMLNELDKLKQSSSSAELRKQDQIPPRLQSILKKPGPHPKQPPPAPPTFSGNNQQTRGISNPPRQQPQQQTGVSRGALSSSLSKSQSQRPSIQSKSFRPTPARRVTRPPTRPVPLPGQATTSTSSPVPAPSTSSSYNQQPRSPDDASRTPVNSQSESAQYSGANVTTTTTGTQRITTYHYSSGSMRFSEQYLERLAAEQRHHQEQQQQQQVAPQRGSNVNYTGRESSVSPKQSPLI